MSYKAILMLTIMLSTEAYSASVPTDFFGVHVGSDPTSGSYIVEKFPASTNRIWNTPVGGSSNISQWPNLETARGVYSWTNFDAVITALLNDQKKIIFTFGNVPNWANGSAGRAVPPTSFQDLYDFATSVSARHGNDIKFWELWNEFSYGSSWWTGTDAQMATISKQLYSIIKANSTGSIILSPSVTSGGDNSGKIIPISPFYHWDTYLSLCNASGPCFDALNVHGYPGGLTETVADNTVKFAPELWVSEYNIIKAVANQDGFSGYDLYVDEGFSGLTAGDNSTTFNSDALAGEQARLAILMASTGVVNFDYFGYGTQCATQGVCGDSSGGIQGLNSTGLAFRSVMGWLAGATFTTPMTRQTAANSISTAPDDASTTVGLVAGAGGCSGAPAGVGALPTGWTESTLHPGMSAYVVGKGLTNGIHWLDWRVCGTDTTNGVSSQEVDVNFSTNISSSTGTSWVVGYYLALSSGSLTNIKEFDLLQTEKTNAGAYLADTHQQYIYPTTDILDNQHSEIRSRTDNAGVQKMWPVFAVKHYYNGNGSTGTLPVDVTVRIGNPDAETGGSSTQWVGTISKTNPGGYTAQIAWDASGGPSNYTVPAGYLYYRDIYGNSYAISGGVVSLTNLPIIIEKTQWSGIL